MVLTHAVSDVVEAGVCGAPGEWGVDIAVAAGDLPFDCLAGHIHPCGEPVPDRMIGNTRVVNVVGRRVLGI
jgi:hypothetical protein